MRIWFCSAYDAPRGQSSRTYDFARELADSGHEVTFFTSSYDHFTRVERLDDSESVREETIDGIHVIWLRTTGYRTNPFARLVNMFSNALGVIKIAARKEVVRPDIVVGPSVPIFTALAAYHLARKNRAAFIFEVRDVWPQALVDLRIMHRWNPFVFLIRVIEKFLCRHADHIVFVLPLAAEHIVKSGGSLDRMTWIPNGVPRERRTPNWNPSDRTKTMFSVVYVGGMSNTHDLKTLLDAAQILREKYENVRISIYGGGGDDAKYRDYAGTSGLDNVDFFGLIPKSEIPAVLRGADVLVSCVRDTPVYQFGINSNKIIDYLAAGRPIVFSGSAPKNPITDARAGVVVLPERPDLLARAIQELYEMPRSERDELGRSGWSFVNKELKIEHLVSRYSAAMQGAIEYVHGRGV